MASVSKRDYAQFAGGKAKSLLLPMVAWNLITVGLVVFFAHFGDLRAPKPALGMAFLNEIFHLTAAGEINVQNAFLRDIFIKSEEHTSELQSLMRISYAVFCLKKKKTNIQNYLTTTHQTTHISSTTHNLINQHTKTRQQ